MGEESNPGESDPGESDLGESNPGEGNPGESDPGERAQSFPKGTGKGSLSPGNSPGLPLRVSEQDMEEKKEKDMNIFLLEDDDAITMGLTYSLEKEGYTVTHRKTAAQARLAWENGRYDLVILDINLPDGNGYDVCRFIKNNEDVPVIFLTAADAEVNVVMGLELGADDYICKPFRINELMARIRTVLRRSGKRNAAAGETGSAGNTGNAGNGPVRVGNLRIYTNEARVTAVCEAEPGKEETEKEKTEKEETIELTALEYRLLLTFCSNRGIVLSRKNLLQEMWDVSGDFVNDNTLTVYIKRLRDKIEKDPSNPKIIKTVRGLGYIMEKDK